MFPILLRVLTIAGTCTVAALLTREFMRRKALRDEEAGVQRSTPLSIEEKNDSNAVSQQAKQGLDQQATAQADSNARFSSAAELASELELQRRKRDDRKAAAMQAKMQADERAGKAARAKSAAQESLGAATKRDSSGKGKEQPDTSTDPAAVRAQTVIGSSRNILQTYKQPVGYTVDLSLAHFTAERLYNMGRFDEAWAKAGAVGMLVGMAEIRANVESELKSLSKDSAGSEKTKEVRQTLNEADGHLAEASKSFVTDKPDDSDAFVSQLQQAMAKTMKAMNEVNTIKLA